MGFQLVDERVAAVDAGFDRNKSTDRLAFDFVLFADDRSLSHFLMIDQRAFHFHRADSMAGDIHHVVDPAEQPIVTVFIALAAVAGKIFSRETAPIGWYEPVRIAVA